MTTRRAMNPRALACAAALVAATAVVGGQQHAALTGPLIGVVWHAESAELRAVAGTPGNALIGEPLEIAVPVAHVLPIDAHRVLLSSPSASALLSGRVTADGLALARIADADLTPSISVLSAGGSAAALYDGERRRVVVLGGLPDHPHVLRTIEISPFNLPIVQMAVGDGGERLALAFAGPAAAAIYVWTPAAGLRLVSDVDAVSALLFVEDALLVANPARGDLVLGRDLETSPRWERLAGRAQGLVRPVGLAATSARRIHVADADARLVLTLDERGRVLARQSCVCEMTGLHPLQPYVYRLTDRVDRTMFLLDARSGAPRITFVPPARRQAQDLER